MIIEAGFGLGEAIVSSLIASDSYVVEKDNLKIIENNISEQDEMIVLSKNEKGTEIISVKSSSSQKLSDSDIIKLAELCLKIERYYHKPQDIEWAFLE